jgi:hypothetical protein
MSCRVQVVLPDPVATQLRELATAVGDPPSTLAGQMVRSGVADAASGGVVRPTKPRPRPLQTPGDQRAPWLEPYGGDHRWSREMWGAIVALHGRYPVQLESLKDGWWNDESHAETLCALAVWRAEIDDGGEDPREELAFHAQLGNYARVLREQGGGVAKAWKPGAPPASWERP